MQFNDDRLILKFKVRLLLGLDKFVDTWPQPHERL